MTANSPKINLTPAGDSLVQLEFAKVVRLISGKTQTSFGKILVEEMSPKTDLSLIQTAFMEAAEAVQIFQEDGPLPLGSAPDVLLFLEHLRAEGSKLEALALRDIQETLDAVKECKTHLQQSENCEVLRPLAHQLSPIPELAYQIKRSIGSRGEILNSASAELADLRDKLKQERSTIKRHLEKLLNSEKYQATFQELIITDRNGRYVVPVRADQKGRLKGFVHDISSSGQTLYLEPASVLENNNRIQTLGHLINREEDRILLNLSASVRLVRHLLEENQKLLAQLDRLQAVARFSLEMDCVFPDLAHQPCLKLLGARHPLLVSAKKNSAEDPTVVPIEVCLTEECQALILSGPNTGGKTLALKTAGLLVLMVRAGLPVPCSPGSRLFPFAKVLTDIGDNQSIEANLSTYSGHLLRWRNILEQADNTTLALMDELGTGTDPGEGSALALAMVDALRKRGVRIIATTHLQVIKGYAQLQDQVENVAVEFDSETLQPTYRLHYGLPGASHAFTIAKRVGLPTPLLEAAMAYLGQGERDGGVIIEKLNSLKEELDDELTEARILRSNAEAEYRRFEADRKNLHLQRQSILDEVRQEGKQILSAAENKLKELFNKASKVSVQPKERAEITSSLRKLAKALPQPLRQEPGQVPQEVQVHEVLFVPSLGVEAEVISVDGDKIELHVGGKKLRLSRQVLRQFMPRQFAKQEKAKPRIRDSVERQAFMPRLVLVGKRADDAQVMLSRFLDEALLYGEKELEIVHGSGQGVLRKTVRQFLANRSEVNKFHPADPRQGGDNVTVVELRH